VCVVDRAEGVSTMTFHVPLWRLGRDGSFSLFISGCFWQSAGFLVNRSEAMDNEATDKRGILVFVFARFAGWLAVDTMRYW
jgi:hypothetical protein